MGSECHSASGKQGNASEVQPDVNVHYEESKDVASESNSNQPLNRNECNSSEVVGTINLIQATKLPARHRNIFI